MKLIDRAYKDYRNIDKTDDKDYENTIEKLKEVLTAYSKADVLMAKIKFLSEKHAFYAGFKAAADMFLL